MNIKRSALVTSEGARVKFLYLLEKRLQGNLNLDVDKEVIYVFKILTIHRTQSIQKSISEFMLT